MRKFLAVLLSLVLVFGCIPASFAADADVFPDVKDTPYEEAVSALVDLGVIDGYSDGTFKPKGNLDRAAVAKIILYSLDYNDPTALKLYTSTFPDVKNSWSRYNIAYMQKVGLAQGGTNGKYEPLKSVSQPELVTFILRALGYTDEGLGGKWPANYVTEATELGLFDDVVDVNKTSNKKACTRGDMAIILYNAFDLAIAEDKDDTFYNRLTTEEVVDEGIIPFGQRLVDMTGLDGAVADSTDDIDNSPYYEINDFYNATSSNRLTMLTGFKTIQQATGWTCGLTSILMTLEWYGMRDGINEMDLHYNRGKDNPGATSLKQMLNVFNNLNKKLGYKFNVKSTYDTVWEDDYWFPKLEVEKGKKLGIDQMIPYYLEKGVPIIVGWQDWGGHYQVIVGYDDMGTDMTGDDIIILADPYDTTDHKQDGFIVQSYERFIWDWSAQWDPDYEQHIFVVAEPAGYKYDGPKTGSGIADDKSNSATFTTANMIPYPSKLPAQLAEMATKKPYDEFGIYIGENGLSGPADSAYFQAGNYNNSPYYKNVNPYTMNSTSTRTILTGYKTIQQATEYTCGLTSMVTAMNWFNKLGDYSEVDLANMRDKTDGMPGATSSELVNVAKNLNKAGGNWTYYSTADLVEGDGDLGSGLMLDGKYVDMADMFDYFLSDGVPVMVMWHEWGAHWQVVIGIDDMGTPDTQDDVLIMVDPYDTTDHNQDGYVIESYERLIWDWTNSYDANVDWGSFFVMHP